MNLRRLALLVAATSSWATAYAQEARADECGSPKLEARSVDIFPNPAAGCIKATGGGTYRPGCDQMTLELKNDCPSTITVVLEAEADCTDTEVWGVESCLEIPPGNIGYVDLLADEEGVKEYEFPVLLQGQIITLYVTADIVDISGCAVSNVGADGAPRTWAWVAGIGLALAGLQRRKRLTAQTTRRGEHRGSMPPASPRPRAIAPV